MKRLYAYILLFSLIIIGICGYLLYFVSTNSVFTSVNNLKKPVTVIIDAGHGGFDGGAVAKDGTQEKGINLSIAEKLNRALNDNGVKTVMTRTDDNSIHDADAATIREQKVSDIHNRLKIMEKTDSAVFVSIHQNSYTSSQYWGTQVFYCPKFDESRELAHSIQTAVVNGIQPDNKRVIKQCGKEVYLIYNAVKPAVLVECGFMTNPGELEKLKNEEYQQKMAECIAKGIIDYIKGS